jgi:hypothetical protein
MDSTGGAASDRGDAFPLPKLASAFVSNLLSALADSEVFVIGRCQAMKIVQVLPIARSAVGLLLSIG